ncbi:response regulator transcription factor [Saccharomonospora xinjiangensis]|uniref:Response regulator containing a CheY-like receiver domain and an HTH DNA-binding domain n=1 Tax=Saccharomonospora xinjiangensis XJ-54 TaxID=882086 RepID=I0V1R1_9PSEU|nr:response regulator transcription factor [Saccharomonospora xinjiangensis]EID54064.1 response regulator containing a CheY-like receiver domain and an HTH DNA-binding domain [Saccharomonospora xinjiangensis XJ-54]
MTSGDRDEITVVLAEDQTMVLEAFAELLGLQPDITVLATATNGPDALTSVTEHDPDVLVTDIEMPGTSGLDVAAELHRRGSRTGVLIVTTFARSGYLRRALNAGVSGYLLKDSPISELADALRKVRAGEKVISKELALAAWDHTDDQLTDRERQLLREVAEGASNRDIARRLHLAEGTVRNYLSTAMAKLHARNRTDAAKIARERGWI